MTDEKAVLASARAQMMYDANKKSAGVSFLLLIFLGSKLNQCVDFALKA